MPTIKLHKRKQSAAKKAAKPSKAISAATVEKPAAEVVAVADGVPLGVPEDRFGKRSWRAARAANHQAKRQARRDKRAAAPKLPPAYRLFIQACKLPWQHWEVFGGILLLYAVLNLVLIGGVSGGSDLSSVKQNLGDVFTGQFGKLTTGLALFGFLISQGTGTMASGVASAYQTVMLLVASLALIWALRQVYAGHKVRIRDTFYEGMAPFVKFILVLLFIGLQLVPAAAGGFLFSILVGNGIVQGLYETVAVTAIFFLLLAWSIYMLCASAFALYVVTLPRMTPWQAVKSAKEVVNFRRAVVLRKLLFLPLAMLVVSAVIMVPVALILTPAAPAVFFVLSILGVLVVHSYLYALYRELIA